MSAWKASRLFVCMAALTLSTSLAAPASPGALGVGSSYAATSNKLHRADVNGDGHADRVRIRRRHHSERATVVVRLAGGERLTRRIEVSSFTRAWFGAAPLDGRAGEELVLGHTSGAHTEFFQVLTLRRDRLRFESAPGRGDDWTVDSAANFSLGIWRHRRDDGRVRIVLRSAHRTESGEFRGRDTKFRWIEGAWNRTGSRMRHYHDEDDAYAIAGWHVRGLPRF